MTGQSQLVSVPGSPEPKSRPTHISEKRVALLFFLWAVNLGLFFHSLLGQEFGGGKGWLF